MSLQAETAATGSCKRLPKTSKALRGRYSMNGLQPMLHRSLMDEVKKIQESSFDLLLQCWCSLLNDFVNHSLRVGPASEQLELVMTNNNKVEAALKLRFNFQLASHDDMQWNEVCGDSNALLVFQYNLLPPTASSSRSSLSSASSSSLPTYTTTSSSQCQSQGNRHNRFLRHHKHCQLLIALFNQHFTTVT
ncbi:hypothetical protein DFJ73DRAFT_785579 [Zopfochytrium polystomum]|nr:hypothetical protein DFJ73DRAFT_785579 [Zopfochytrium polystomum]